MCGFGAPPSSMWKSSLVHFFLFSPSMSDANRKTGQSSQFLSTAVTHNMSVQFM